MIFIFFRIAENHVMRDCVAPHQWGVGTPPRPQMTSSRARSGPNLMTFLTQFFNCRYAAILFKKQRYVSSQHRMNIKIVCKDNFKYEVQERAASNAVSLQQLAEEYWRIDKFFLISFPILFFIFNIIYWLAFILWTKHVFVILPLLLTERVCGVHVSSVTNYIKIRANYSQEF